MNKTFILLLLVVSLFAAPLFTVQGDAVTSAVTAEPPACLTDSQIVHLLLGKATEVNCHTEKTITGTKDVVFPITFTVTESSTAVQLHEDGFEAVAVVREGQEPYLVMTALLILLILGQSYLGYDRGIYRSHSPLIVEDITLFLGVIFVTTAIATVIVYFATGGHLLEVLPAIYIRHNMLLYSIFTPHACIGENSGKLDSNVR